MSDCEETLNKGKFCHRIDLKDFFGYVEHQQNGTYILGHNLILNRNNAGNVCCYANGTDHATGAHEVGITSPNVFLKVSVFIIGIGWYVPHLIPIEPQDAILSKPLISTEISPTEKSYIDRSVLKKL